MGENWLESLRWQNFLGMVLRENTPNYQEDPAIYDAADRLLEATDWVVWQLTGKETRNSCTAGYKAIWSKKDGFPSPAFFKALHPKMENVVAEKMSTESIHLAKKPVV